MSDLRFSYEDCLIPRKEILKTAVLLKPEIENMIRSREGGYEDERASINLPDDKIVLDETRKIIQRKSILSPQYLVVIGIGGSNLGTMAVQEALQGKLHNQTNEGIKVLWADTVDSDQIGKTSKVIESSLDTGNNVLLNVISKSGETTETIANLEILLSLLEKHLNDLSEFVVVTSDKDSELWKLALEEKYDILEIPKKVEGRYSVFSPVGLFPLGLLGLDIEHLLDGARHMRDMCIKMDIEENPAAVGAAIHYLQYCRRNNIADLFLFSTDLESMGKWYRQLLAESLGKEHNRKGKRVNVGITPTVSIGSTDLHSVAQLYLGGPYDKFTTFVSVARDDLHISVPVMRQYSKIVQGIQGKRLEEIMDAILEGTKRAYRNDKRPFIQIEIPDKSEYSIGQFLQLKMVETIYLGYLLDVNPFDQPNVESYKEETRKILSKNGNSS